MLLVRRLESRNISISVVPPTGLSLNGNGNDGNGQQTHILQQTYPPVASNILSCLASEPGGFAGALRCPPRRCPGERTKLRVPLASIHKSRSIAVASMSCSLGCFLCWYLRSLSSIKAANFAFSRLAATTIVGRPKRKCSLRNEDASALATRCPGS